MLLEEYFIEIAGENVWLAYGFLFLSAVVENLFPPVPGDTVTLIGAFFVGRGVLDFYGVLISTTLGSVAGFMMLFGLAYRLGWEYFEEKQIKWLNPTQLKKVDRWFDRFGYWIIFANRFLPGVRSIISISAGLSKLRIMPVILLATISAAIWNFLFIYAGAVIGKSKEEILNFVSNYNRVFMVLFALLIIGFLVHTIRKRLSRKSAK